MKPHCQAGTHPLCLLGSHSRACCPGKGPAPVPPVRIRYAKSTLLVLCCLWHCSKSFWTPLAATSMDWPHKSWCEGRQSAAGKGWGFGTASGVVDQWGTQLDQSLGENIWVSRGLILQRAGPLPCSGRGRWGCSGSWGGPRVLCWDRTIRSSSSRALLNVGRRNAVCCEEGRDWVTRIPS